MADYTEAFLNAEVFEGEQLYAPPLEGWNPKVLNADVLFGVRKAFLVSEHLRDAGKNFCMAS